MPAKYVLFGHFGASNWGNESTLLAAIQGIRRLQPRAELILLSSRPEDTRKRYGLPCVGLLDAQRDMRAVRDRRAPALHRLLALVAAQPVNLAAMLRTLHGADALIMTGTGMITDWGEGPLGLPLSMWQWCTVAAALRCRVIFLSVGVERIEHPIARLLLRRALERADYRSFRDEHSRGQLARLGLHVDADPIYPDLAFGLQAQARTHPAHEQLAVVLGVFSYRDRGTTSAEGLAAYREYIDKLGAFVLFVRAQGHTVRLTIGDASDLPVVEDLQAWLTQRSSPRASFDAPNTVEQVLAQLGNADLVVATRFHSVLLALRLGRPAISIGYEAKSDALMKSLGLSEYCQSLEELSVPRLTEQFSHLAERVAQVSASITERAAGFEAQLHAQYAALFASRTSHLPM